MQIFKQLVEISLRKREPQDIDYSVEAVAILFMAIVYLRYDAFNAIESLSNPFLYSVVSMAGELAFLYLIFASRDKTNRLVQTLTVLFGVSVLIVAVGRLMTLTVILQLAIPMLFIWSIYLSVFILRKALECSAIVSLLLTFGYTFFGLFVVVMLFPEFEAQMLIELDNIKAAMEAAQLQAELEAKAK